MVQGNSEDGFSFEVQKDNNKSTAMAVVTGLALVAMWAAIGTILTMLILASSFNGFLAFVAIVVGGSVTASVL